MVKSSKVQVHRPDFILFGTAITLILFGLLMVYNASPVTSLRDFGDPLHLIRLQVIWSFGGLIVGFIIFRIPYRFWQKMAPIIMIFSILLLITVFIPGFGAKIYGAQRWLRIGIFSIQPAEFAKLAYIIYLAAFLSKKVKIIPFMVVTAIVAGIVLGQRDMGTTIIITSIGMGLYFIAGGPFWHLFTLIPIVVGSGAVLIITSAYRKARLLAFLNPDLDPGGITYHISQALIALGSGGWFGVGLGESRQKYGFIPEVTTDSIFAVIGNELGFIGSSVLILGFVLIIFRGFKIAMHAPDKFSYLTAAGITIWISVQSFLNIAGLSAALPLTGVPLPFISYGGSSLVSIMFAMAILLNISRYTKSRA